MKERIEKAGGMENYDKVVKLFTPVLMIKKALFQDLGCLFDA